MLAGLGRGLDLRRVAVVAAAEDDPAGPSDRAAGVVRVGEIRQAVGAHAPGVLQERAEGLLPLIHLTADIQQVVADLVGRRLLAAGGVRVDVELAVTVGVGEVRHAVGAHAHGVGETSAAQPGPPPAPVPAAAGVVVVHVVLLFRYSGAADRACAPRCTAWAVAETFPRRGSLLAQGGRCRRRQPPRNLAGDRGRAGRRPPAAVPPGAPPRIRLGGDAHLGRRLGRGGAHCPPPEPGGWPLVLFDPPPPGISDLQALSAAWYCGLFGSRSPPDEGLSAIPPWALGSGKSEIPCARMHRAYLRACALAAACCAGLLALCGGSSGLQALLAALNCGELRFRSVPGTPFRSIPPWAFGSGKSVIPCARMHWE